MRTLKDRLRWVRDNRFGGSASAWSVAADLQRVHVGKMLSRPGTDAGHVELAAIVKLADAAKVPRAWLAFGTGSADDDPPIATLLLRVQRFPGLADAIERSPERWRTSTIARAVAGSFPTTADGSPLGGWDALLDTLQELGTFAADSTDVTRLAAAQVGRRPKLPPKRSH